MKSREFLELCKKNKAVQGNIVVLYKGIIYHPIRMVIWIDDDLNEQISVVLQSPLSKSEIQAPLKDIEYKEP